MICRTCKWHRVREEAPTDWCAVPVPPFALQAIHFLVLTTGIRGSLKEVDACECFEEIKDVYRYYPVEEKE